MAYFIPGPETLAKSRDLAVCNSGQIFAETTKRSKLIATVESVENLPVQPLAQLHRRRSAKWRMYEQDVLPMGLAEMDLPVAEPIQAGLSKMIAESDLGYGAIAPELGQAFSSFAGRRWGWESDPSQCWLVTDVAIAGIETMRQFCEAGDKVGISSPVYYDFQNWISEANCEVVDIPLQQIPGNGWRLDLNGIESAFTSGLTAYILCNPHNPVGYVPSRSELEQLADLADEHNVLVISDEIHAPLIYPGQTFTPYLSVNAQSRRTGVLITSASKAWNTAGLKCAQIITQDTQRAAAFSHFPEHISWRASLLGAWANIIAYNQCSQWLESALSLFDSNRKLVAQLLDEHLPQARYQIPQATYLAWIDISAYREQAPAAFIREQARVAFSEGTDFGPAGAGHIRLNFGTSAEIISQAISRTANVLGA